MGTIISIEVTDNDVEQLAQDANVTPGVAVMRVRDRASVIERHLSAVAGSLVLEAIEGTI